MLMSPKSTVALIIDVQEKLTPGIHKSQKLIDNCEWLIKLAKLVDVPLIVTEQYPRGVGHTVEQLRQHLEGVPVAEKTIFSCVDSPECQALKFVDQYDNFILSGMETHVCIMQTALQLVALKKNVFVAVDAVSSRNPEDTQYALQRMQQYGVILVTKEMVGFEWLRDSKHPDFKDFSKNFLQ